MGPLQLHGPAIHDESTLKPASPLQATDLDHEDSCLAAAGATGFYMSNVASAAMEEGVARDEKVSNISYVGDERKGRRSFGYGDENAEKKKATASTARATLEEGERKNREYPVSGRVEETSYKVEEKAMHKKREEDALQQCKERGDEERKEEEEEEEVDYVHRGQWLRAAILGANDGLVSTASLMMGVGAVKEEDPKAMVISGLASLVGGACSMAIGEFVSVYSQRDAETFGSKQKKDHHLIKNTASPLPTHEDNTTTKKTRDLEGGFSSPFFGKFLPTTHDASLNFTPSKIDSPPLTTRGASFDLTPTKGALLRGVSHAPKQDMPSTTRPCCSTLAKLHRVLLGFTKDDDNMHCMLTDSSKAHTTIIEDWKQDEVEVGPSPWEAAGASGLSFAFGAMVPLLSASFIKDHTLRLCVMMGVSSAALICMGAIGAKLSAGSVMKGGIRVLFGGWAAMLVTYCLLRLFGTFGV